MAYRERDVRGMKGWSWYVLSKRIVLVLVAGVAVLVIAVAVVLAES